MCKSANLFDDSQGIDDTEDSIVDSKESLLEENIVLNSTKGRELMNIKDEERKSKKKKIEHQEKLKFNDTNSKVKNDSSVSEAIKAETGINNKDSENTNSKLNTKNQSANIFSPFSIEVENSNNNIQSPLFNPSNVKKEMILSKKKNESIVFSILTDTLTSIERLKGSGSGSKKGCIVILANLFRLIIHHSPKDLVGAVYICMNKVAPDYEGKESGVGESLLIKCISEASDKSEKRIKEDQISGKYEDLGEIASLSKKQIKLLFEPPRLTISEVYRELYSLTDISGKNSQQLKKDKIKKLLVSGRQEEVKFIVRFLQGRLRVGINQTSVYQALANAFVLTRNNDRISYSDYRLLEKEKRIYNDLYELDKIILNTEKLIKDCLCQLPNIEKIINSALNCIEIGDIEKECRLTTGIPCEPMLAKPTKGLKEVLDRFENILFTAEYKYDGERAQIHVNNDCNDNRIIKIFTRNLESATERYPDLIEYLNKSLNPEVKDCILDSEVVAFSHEDNKILPFQVLNTRKRKNVTISDIQTNICLLIFDCMKYNNESLLKKSLYERRQYMRRCILANGDCRYIKFATSCETDKIEMLDSFLAESIENSCEGLMIKTLHENASYEPSKRSLNWLKIKKDYVDGLMDSIDVVPIAACYGKGRRSGLFGTFLLAVYNTEDEVYETICKAGTGFSDELLQLLFNNLKDHILTEGVPKSYYRYDSTSTSLKQDVWFEPKLVWEIKGADLSLSPVHTAARGIIDENRGISLRFPRFIRIRDDKSPEQSTCSMQITDLYRSQFRHASKVDSNDNGCDSTLNQDV
ncbi:hypothetical protein FG386_001693 [Cryptosporidium ryanae]|uniref:uncharacterized protein n=1 Tax=Cryptosporidium ryanae TaxID=515981 RepID=UPI003519E8BE|nr:hypothetical protein FG386_001693 [Cryptosporidium ryanae]